MTDWPSIAPNIVANTFLAQLSDETLKKIRYGFLEHCECEFTKWIHIYLRELTTPQPVKATINGHLAWTMMNASGNRGDDIRALHLCEMQPYQFLHPNNETSVYAVLGLQSDQEHKARSKAMRTVEFGCLSFILKLIDSMIDDQSHIYLFYHTSWPWDVSNCSIRVLFTPYTCHCRYRAEVWYWLDGKQVLEAGKTDPLQCSMPSLTNTTTDSAHSWIKCNGAVQLNSTSKSLHSVIQETCWGWEPDQGPSCKAYARISTRKNRVCIHWIFVESWLWIWQSGGWTNIETWLVARHLSEHLCTSIAQKGLQLYRASNGHLLKVTNSKGNSWCSWL